MELPVEDGLRLRTLDNGDVAELHGLVERDRDHLSPWLPWAAAQTPLQTAEFVRKARLQAELEEGLEAAVERDGRIVGMAGLHAVDWDNRSAALGYWLARSEQGRGTMTLAVGALLDHAFCTWELNRVEVRCALGNERSRRIPERLGFTKEGVARESQRFGDRYLDSVVYALLAREWAPPRS
ncbi:MAG: GNAT family protein [Solirubrobacterales bacterium]